MRCRYERGVGARRRRPHAPKREACDDCIGGPAHAWPVRSLTSGTAARRERSGSGSGLALVVRGSRPLGRLVHRPGRSAHGPLNRRRPILTGRHRFRRGAVCLQMTTRQVLSQPRLGTVGGMAWPFRVTDPLLDVLEVLLDTDEELHGWAIMKRTQRTGPTVYQVLERLRKAGWVECWWEDPATPAAPDSGVDESGEGGELVRRENVPRRRYYRLSGEGAAKAPALLTERGRRRRAGGRAAPGFATFSSLRRLRAGGA